MKTIRGIFLTTQGHSGTAVPKDCELNERERDRRYGLSFFARSGVLWIFRSFITTLFTRQSHFRSGVIRAILPRDAENERVDRRATRTAFINPETFRNNFKKLSRRATRVYFAAEHLGPSLASRDFNFARLAAARSPLAFLLVRDNRGTVACASFVRAFSS